MAINHEKSFFFCCEILNLTLEEINYRLSSSRRASVVPQIPVLQHRNNKGNFSRQKSTELTK